ncbi:uncharacterized [Tachysurus ichikawai]
MRGEGDSHQLGSSFLRSSDVIKKWNDFDVSGNTERYREIEKDSETGIQYRQQYGFMEHRREEQETPCPPPVPVILPSKRRLKSVCVVCYWDDMVWSG